ncbi:MAG: signal transduction histidine kinase [Bacteriovoracaceae bacterium]|jgi:signal transduction histidine kinase
MKLSKISNKVKNLEYNNLYPLFFTLIFILILIQYSFNSLDAIFYDLWSRSDILTKKNNNIITITMDEESDQFLGEVYPYTYATHIRFIKKLLGDSPKGIGYLVPFQEPESASDQEYIKEFKSLILDYKTDFNFFRLGTDKDAWGEQIPPQELRDLGFSLSLLNKDGNIFAKDNVTRRAILNISGEDSFHLWMANKLQKLNNLDVVDATGYKGSYYDLESDATFALFKYSENPNNINAFDSIPFHRVVVGNYPKGYFKNKIVIIGSSYLSNSGDFVYTPFGKENSKAPKINVHAEIIDALINYNTIYSVPPWATDLFAILIAIFLSYIISKVQPTKGLLITMLIMLSIFLVTYLFFITFGIWFKISHVILSIFVVYYIWVPFRAIGEYQTRYAIQEETKVLKKVDKLKQNFISLMSHDLKTPVAKIAGIADILKVQYDNNQKQDELLTNIVESTKELNNFITSILDLTKIESRELALKLENKDVNPLVEATIDKLKFEANAQNMTITSDLSPLYPIKLDVNLINRAFGNIIGNAIKYAGKGTEIHIKTWDDDTWVYIEIVDNGKGIGGEDLENIFEKFYRVKDDESHKIKGSGLGLYLVKYFIELHQGLIKVESTVDEGTKFLIQLKNE